ncbi:MerR family transcriptional regulator [Paenibacillus odorifer]|uniref:MerR family transcriptional regulator n=1 Tax=Paenibacillus TaxID=44249 RepID=UPI0009D77095
MNNISQIILKYYDVNSLLKLRKNEMNGYRYFTNNDIKTVSKIKITAQISFFN